MTAAVCFGVPHATLGEEIEAAVTLSEPATEADLLAYCRERLAEFKRPKKIHIVTEIPRTATGKIQRRAVAAGAGGARRLFELGLRSLQPPAHRRGRARRGHSRPKRRLRLSHLRGLEVVLLRNHFGISFRPFLGIMGNSHEKDC